MSWIQGRFSRAQVSIDLAEEIRQHLNERADELVRSGMSPEEARAAARREFGNVTLIEERSRDVWRWPVLEDLLADVRQALRQVERNPGFAAVVVLVLALGIGANSALFSVVNELFLRPLNVAGGDRLVELAFGQKGAAGEFNFSYPDFRDLRERESGLMDLFAFRVGSNGLSDGLRADRIVTSFVTGNYFTALGLKPALGRLITSAEGDPSGVNPVMVLGYSYWRSRFNGDPGVIGKQVSVNGHAVTIIGVAPEGFRGLLSIVDMQAYLPVNMATIEGHAHWIDERNTHDLYVLGRRRRGVSLRQAQASLNVVAAALSREFSKTDVNAVLRVFPQREAKLNPQPLPGHYNREIAAAGLFLVLAGLLLLLACFNVANLLLVRSTAREHEMAVRAALGAARGRLVRQLLTESLLLALLGGAAGIVAGVWASATLSSLNFNIGVPYRFDFGFDWRVLVYTLAATIAAGIVVGIVPAARASRARPQDALHGESRTIAGGRHVLRNALVAAQVAGSVVLLIAAGLFTRSLRAVQRADLGFDPHHVLNLSMDPTEVGYSMARGQQFYKELLRRVRALAGVRSASLAAVVPLGVSEDDDAIYPEGRLPPPGQTPPRFFDNQVSPGYFETMRIPILEGRAFTDADDAKAPLVAIVNQTMARRLWPNEDPIGRRFKLWSESNPWTKVVGVAKDGKYRIIWGQTLPYFYLPEAQDTNRLLTLQVRTSQSPDAAAQAVEQQIRELAPGLPVFEVQTMEQALDGPYGLFDFHVGAALALALGLLGLVLAVVGVYGVVSYAAGLRTHEIGVRLALGAHPRDIWRMVFAQGLGIVGAGLLVGLLAACAAARVMASYLYGISAYDPLTFVSVAALLAVVALAACAVPARRAMRVDPMAVLRSE